MTTRKSLQSLLVIAVTGSLLACGGQNGFNSTNSSSNDGGGNGSLANGSGTPEYNALDMKSYVSGGVFDKSLVIDLDKVNQELIVTVPLSLNPFIGQASYQPANLPGVQIFTVTNGDGSSSLVARVPFRYICKNPVTFLPPGKLPNGDPLPNFPGGELPTTAIVLNSSGTKVNMYIGVDGLAFFVESKFSLGPLGFIFPIMSHNPVQTLGYVGWIPPKSSYQGGMYLAVKLPANISRILDENVRL